MTSGDLALFALNASRNFGELVAGKLKVPLSAHEEREFEDGEHKVRSLSSVRDKDVYVIQSLYGDDTASPNDKLCRLLFFIGALKDAAAAQVTAVIPYLCYARKDRKTKSRDPVTTRYIAQLFEAVGADRVVAMDVHNLAAYQNAFRCRTEHLEARRLFVEHFASIIGEAEVSVVSPDEGGVKRADAFARAFVAAVGRPVGSAFMEKRRSAGVVSGEALVGTVSGREAVIIDDLIATGGTMLRTASACRKAGATRVFAAATHGLFNGNAAEVLADPVIDGVVIANTVPPFRLRSSPVMEKLVVLDATELVAESIRRLHEGGSIVDLIEMPELE